MSILVKRVYERPAPADGTRVLVDRLWPRGLSKEAARVDVWPKDLAPSHELRRWFNHDPSKWDEFQRRYAGELQHSPEAVASLRALGRRKRLTLVFAAQELRYNNATALQTILAGTRGVDRAGRTRARAKAAT